MCIASSGREADERGGPHRSSDDAVAKAKSERRAQLLPAAEHQQQQLVRGDEYAEHLRRDHQPAGARGLRLRHHFELKPDDRLDDRQNHSQLPGRQPPAQGRRPHHPRQRQRHLEPLARRRREDHQRLGADGAVDSQQLHRQPRSQSVHPRGHLQPEHQRQRRRRDELVPDDILIVKR